MVGFDEIMCRAGTCVFRFMKSLVEPALEWLGLMRSRAEPALELLGGAKSSVEPVLKLLIKASAHSRVIMHAKDSWLSINGDKERCTNYLRKTIVPL